MIPGLLDADAAVITIPKLMTFWKNMYGRASPKKAASLIVRAEFREVALLFWGPCSLRSS